jgi:hypothetical protein
MKRLAVILATVVVVGWASTRSFADVPGDGDVFYVCVFDNNGYVEDKGFFKFERDQQTGQLHFLHYWQSSGFEGSEADWSLEADFGDSGCEIDVWNTAYWTPFDEFDFVYLVDKTGGVETGTLIGYAEKHGLDDDYSLYGSTKRIF